MEFGAMQILAGAVGGVIGALMPRRLRGNQWARDEWSVARNEGTDEAQRRLIFGDWPVADSKIRI